MEAALKRHKAGYAYVRSFDPAEQTNIWKVRKAGLGLLLGMKGERKPIAFVEDCAVEPSKLPEFFVKFRDVIQKYKTSAAYYGHASVGCLHIRPLINTKNARDIQVMKDMTDEIADLVIDLGGGMSGEHGDGLARSHLNEKLFGSQLYNAFRQVKAAFDPDHRMNPGKIVDAPPMTENLRYGTEYRTIAFDTHYDFSREGGFATAVELCNGTGVCRKKNEGTMCPSYMVTLEDKHSTRGRANLMREILSGKLPAEEFTGKDLYDTFVNYNYPDIGKATVLLLEAAGYEVRLAQRKCCGRPMISKGLPKAARENAEFNIVRLCSFVDKGYSIIGCEPSCILTFRDEYPVLVKSRYVKELAKASFLLEEFFVKEKQAGRWNLEFEQQQKKALIHEHCHEKSLID